MSYDTVGVSGTASLNGSLHLAFHGGFHSTVTPGNTFTLLSASTLSGAFANVANGGRLGTLDGFGSFQVNYGAGSPFATNSLVLSNFVAVPEPSTWALLIAGALAVGIQLRRRKA